MTAKKRTILLILFMTYMSFLFYMTFTNGFTLYSNMLDELYFRIHFKQQLNLIPFKTIKLYFRNFNYYNKEFWINIIGNIVIIIPYGIFLPMLWQKFRSFWRIALACLLLPVFIEIVQLFVGRTTDVDDVILNFTGGMIGAVLFKIISLIHNHKHIN